MNRITAILLAMAALLVHMLVVHRNGLGAFGSPYESAHAAFRLGRNLVHEGGLHWSLDPVTGSPEGGLGSYPSPLLIWISAALEWLAAVTTRGYFVVTRGVQVIGMGCVMGTVFLLTRFDTDRNAGVIPALLLVFTGAVAAAGASGTEWPIAMFALALSFVTLEHGRSRFATVGLLALALSSPVGVVCTATLFLQTALQTLWGSRTSQVHERLGRKRSLFAFLPAGLAVLLAHLSGASLMSDLGRAITFDGAVLHQGLARLRDFALVTVSAVLLLFPLVALALGELSSFGRRALVLALVAATTTVLLGGGAAESFDIAFTPALVMSFIAIQQGMARALDTYRRSMERGVWLSIAVVLFVTLAASRFPGDLGQIKLERVQERFYQAKAQPGFGGSDLLGRSALFSEIRLTEELRSIGAFLRDRLPDNATIMTPWPGAIGYQSRHRVIDLYGRTVALPTKERNLWSHQPPPASMDAALAIEPDYILPTVVAVDQLPGGRPIDLLPASLFASDPQPEEALRTSLQARLARYELVVTAAWPSDQAQSPNQHPWVLFRKRGIQRAPRVTAAERNGFLEIKCRFDPAEEPAVPMDRGAGESEGGPAELTQGPTSKRGLTQVFDASITLRLASGELVLLDPRGLPKEANGAEDPPERSISGLVVDPSWDEAVSMARIPLELLKATGQNSQEWTSRPRFLEVHLYHHALSSPAETGISGAEAAEPLVYPIR